MQTDPARVRRTDPGDPDKCPVWDLHKLYTDQATQEWVQEGCRSAAIGCIDCKSRMLDAMLAHLDPIRARGLQLEQNLDYVRQVVADGNDDARDEARDTLEEVRAAIGIDY
jgi:tryptophanyl-tRNA synthetase